jgi:serine protease AprX
MTRSILIVDRMRWMSAAAGSAVLALAASLALFSAHAPLPSLSLSSSSSPVAVPAGSSSPLDPRIAALAAHHPASTLVAIVQFKANVSVPRAQADSAQAGGHVTGTLHIIHALAVQMTAGGARALASSPDVHAVSLNTEITPQGDPMGLNTDQLQTTYNQTLGVLPLWRAGLTGAGVGVAVVDTGINGNLPDFRSGSGNSRVVESAVTNPLARTATDGYGHGTDVAGIIAGNGANRNSSDPLKGQYIGVAPDANLISIKVSNERGRATVLDVIYGLQFAVDHKSDYNLRVVNLSLDSSTPQSYKTDPLDAAVESAWFHGIVVVASAGNRGNASDAVQYAPANDPYVITVGSVDENGSSTATDDTVSSWSSRGTTQDGVQKPDVYAPGAHIVSVLAPHSVFARSCPRCIVDRQYIRTSGTSMAAPMISGLVADLLQLHPGFTPDQVKGALTSPGVAWDPARQEVNATKLALVSQPHLANQGLTPSSLISSATGDINYDMSSWSMSSWSTAQGSLAAGFAMSSWSCASCTGSGGGTAGPSMSSWSMSSWSTLQLRG